MSCFNISLEINVVSLFYFFSSAENVSVKPPSVVKCRDSITSISRQSPLVDLLIITFSENQAIEVPVTPKDHCLCSNCLH